jgi:quinone-modifying oxidoreductase subunit QmoB
MFDDLRTPGAGGEDFYRSGQKKGIIFTKSKVSTVDVSGGDPVVNFKDLILDEDQTMAADLVVLATGQVPNSGPDPYAEMMELADDATEEEKAAATAAHEVAISVDSILNLDYRQGSDLPHLAHGFTDSHFICFPYETRRTGIYAAGPVRRPMDAAQAMIDGTGAAMKAVQECENAAQGRAAHPRSGDLSFPSFRIEGCTQCKRCTVECPFGAINEDEKGYPQYNESRCRRCGTCMGACPVRVISFENYSVDSIGQQIKNVDMPDEFDEKPRILVLACENDAYPALDMAAQNRLEYNAFARVVPIRCLGSVNTIWLTDALNSGYDGIILMGCQKGDDYQCHFVKGSEMAHYRMSKIADTLQQLNLEEERVATYEVAITDVDRVPRLIDEMAETIEKIGMSPFKF